MEFLWYPLFRQPQQWLYGFPDPGRIANKLIQPGSSLQTMILSLTRTSRINAGQSARIRIDQNWDLGLNSRRPLVRIHTGASAPTIQNNSVTIITVTPSTPISRRPPSIDQTERRKNENNRQGNSDLGLGIGGRESRDKGLSFGRRRALWSHDTT
ncbi:hypothetical protein MLD38_027920 [Melastoma candidum]|uniref:Uncharacterized protein n=1 Tax=Melastoma candidum TaxID=119954 RepID=A0ACB9MZL6_9MYRT|nr:hypothetical protein MLD38_027920 [Melastoma candidum]